MNPTAPRTNTQLIDEFTKALASANPDVPMSVVLIGSAARNALTAESDLDLIVLSHNGLKMVETQGSLHVQTMTMERFRERLRSGDDFAAWCVRFGIPIVRSEVWDEVVGSPEASSWPDWQQKIEHAARRLLLASSLRGSGDLDAAGEELVYAVTHVGRALLLKSNVFPLSRPEIIAQLKELGYPSLAQSLVELSFGEKTDRGIKRAMIYVKKLLVHLDRERFEKYVHSRREARNLKKAASKKTILATRVG